MFVQQLASSKVYETFGSPLFVYGDLVSSIGPPSLADSGNGVLTRLAPSS